MKIQHTLLAISLCGVGIANAQTTTNTYSSTTTNSTYTAPVNANTNATTGTTTDATSLSTGNGVTTDSGTATGTTTNGTYSTNTAAPATYGTTTTTTTTSSDLNSAAGNPQRGKGDRAWGKSGKFGIYAGINASRFVNEPIPDDAYRVGWQAGLYGRSGGTVFGQIGLEYRNSTSNLVRTGGNSTTPTAAEVRGRIDQHFVAIPAYVGLRVGSALGLRLQVGAELASLVSIGNNNFNLGEDDLNRTILNGLAGVGINLGPLTLDAVYNLGLQNVFDDGADTKRRILALNLGLRF